MKRLTCLEADALLAEYVEGALAPAGRAPLGPSPAQGAGCDEPARRAGQPARAPVSLLPASAAALVREHLAGCQGCASTVEDMRLALAWSRAAEEVAVPPRLVARILEQTSEGAGEAPGWRQRLRAWFQPVLEPRLAMGTAMALISFSFLLNATGADLSQVTLADLNPARLYFSLDRQAHLAGSRAVKFYRHLRIVYEIQSQLQTLREETAAPQEKKKKEPPPEPQRRQQNRKWSRQWGVMAAGILRGV